MEIKAIETKYKGYRFRSRLEARWAVFFDVLRLKWDYEPEGFEFDGFRYLPDFLLTTGDGNVWLDIKPRGDLSREDELKMLAFSGMVMRDPEMSRHFYVLRGSPWIGEYELLVESYRQSEPFIVSGMTFTHCPLCLTIGIRSHYETFGIGGPGGNTSGLQCMYCDIVDRDWKETERTWFHKGTVETLDREHITQSLQLRMAYTAARSARFEHGERHR